MSAFKVGEVVILQNAVERHELNGMECVITSELLHSLISPAPPFRTYSGHHVLTANGLQICAALFQLRKKHPPAADTSAQEYTALIERLTQRVPA